MAVAINKLNSAQQTGGTTIAVTLTSVPAGELILVFVHSERGLSPGVSSVTATGLTFTQRASIYNSSSGTQGSELWWAIASSGFTGTITATFMSSIDDATIHALSLNGYDSGSLFSGATTVTAQNDTHTDTPEQATFTGGKAGDLVIVSTGSQHNGVDTTPTAGFTQIFSVLNSGGLNWEWGVGAYEVLTGPLSGAAVGFGTAQAWTLIADIIPGPFLVPGQAAAATVTGVPGVVTPKQISGAEAHGTATGIVGAVRYRGDLIVATGNDDYLNATDLGSELAGTATTTTVGATFGSDEPHMFNDEFSDIYGQYSVWFKWTAPNPTALGDWTPTDSAAGGTYQGRWVRIFRLTTTADIPPDAIWTPPANAVDNRTDGSGMKIGADIYVGYPGLVLNPDRYATVPGSGTFLRAAGWNLSNSDDKSTYLIAASRASDGTAATATSNDASNWPGTSSALPVPAGTELWIVATQTPDGRSTPLPLDPSVTWDPTADLGSWTLADGVTPLVPWDLSGIAEVQAGPLQPSERFDDFDIIGRMRSEESNTPSLEVWTKQDGGDWFYIGNPDFFFQPWFFDFVPIGGQEYLIRLATQAQLPPSFDFISSPLDALVLSWALTSDPPPNDNITNAIEIPAGISQNFSGAMEMDLTDATASETFAYTGLGHSVWFKWTAPIDSGMGIYTRSDPGGTLITGRLDVFTSSAAPDDTGSSLVPVANATGGPPSLVFDATAGTTYWIRLDATATSFITIVTLEWSAVPSPLTNDNRADAVALSGTSGTETYTTWGASDETTDGEPLGQGSGATPYYLLSVWYSWNPGVDALLLFSTDDPGTYVEVFACDSDPTTADWTALTPVGDGLGSAEVSARTTEQYVIRLYPFDYRASAIGATLSYEIRPGVDRTGARGGVGTSSGDIALTLPLTTVATPTVMVGSIIDETPGEEIQITVDGLTLAVDDFIDDDGTWDGGILLGELADGDHYVTVTSGSRIGQVGFTVANDIVYYSDPPVPPAPALPTIVSGEWVQP